VSTERDYPYSPTADATKLHGLDKLRAVPDRSVAAKLHAIYVELEPTWRAQERQAARGADYGLRGSAVFPDDYSAADALRPPEPGTAARAAWDRQNAVIFHAWEEWLENLEAFKRDYFERAGCELPREQAEAHRDRFAKLMRRKYGQAFADERWIQSHNSWKERR
jgi:hypothetical protein